MNPSKSAYGTHQAVLWIKLRNAT